MQDLPPLNALRVFAAAAKHQSFTKAAEELGVTQSAVSKQVANVEQHLGRKLFERRHRALALTSDGQLCANAVAECMARLSDKLQALNAPRSKKLPVLTDTDFAQLWLFPRLPKFQKAHPDVEIALTTLSYSEPIRDDEPLEFAISWGRGEWRHHIFEPLLTNTNFLVCKPDFFDHWPPDPNRISEHHLIQDRNTFWWAAFLNILGVQSINPAGGTLYNQTYLCLEAAARGDGIAIGDEVSSRQYLDSGRLIIPFPVRLPAPDSYYILTPRSEGAAQEPSQRFKAWLFEEAAEHRLWFTDFWPSQSSLPPASGTERR